MRGLCKQVINKTHVGKAFQAGAVCHRAMTLALQSSAAICRQKPQDKQHMMTSQSRTAPTLLDSTKCDDTHVTAGMFCRMRAWVQADTIVPLNHLVM